ncbi:hypothetical protein CPB84DRAFT_1750918 [Gymnopilus junonius]|uniref:Uncharacterized protein n=1 Tax=Gymnopilus junonius TaxID=109634 RepID=A0A9P5NDR4_GYMJU|nr:hypothetical protein CPB84DRAFT_1750918 [Gymnopilus junonius]
MLGLELLHHCGAGRYSGLPPYLEVPFRSLVTFIIVGQYEVILPTLNTLVLVHKYSKIAKFMGNCMGADPDNLYGEGSCIHSQEAHHRPFSLKLSWEQLHLIVESPEAITDLSSAQAYDILVEQCGLMVYAHTVLVLIPSLLVPDDIKAFWQYHHLIYQRLKTFVHNRLGNPDWITNFGVLPLDMSYEFPPVDPNSIPLTNEILAKAWALHAAELAREEANCLDASTPSQDPSPFHPVCAAKCKVIATLGEGSKVKKAKVIHNNTKAKTPALLLEAMESIHHHLPPKIHSQEVVPWITTKQASTWHAEVAGPVPFAFSADPPANTFSLIDNEAEETRGSGSEGTESTSSEDGSSDEDDPIQQFIKSGVEHQLTHQDPDAQDEEMETDED